MRCKTGLWPFPAAVTEVKILFFDRDSLLISRYSNQVY
ncbi:hypothetical protein EDC23_2391 [Thiohalophilus thiocyanatoxydans]|uniref:Uncharacterized protein n=1 Tax=Thiohalophilus thiocyanatoxydans TaxID=381308 RepID=A0A4R8IHB2_9GAMM|nr:hypothetical protein EDC23_2391 [Thiohalophilus thiocyanatoxydans]